MGMLLSEELYKKNTCRNDGTRDAQTAAAWNWVFVPECPFNTIINKPEAHLLIMWCLTASLQSILDFQGDCAFVQKEVAQVFF